MSSESIRREIYTFGAQAVLPKHCNRADEFWWAVCATKKALEKVEQAGENSKDLQPTVDELDRAMHYVRCAANGLLYGNEKRKELP